MLAKLNVNFKHNAPSGQTNGITNAHMLSNRIANLTGCYADIATKMVADLQDQLTRTCGDFENKVNDMREGADVQIEKILEHRATQMAEAMAGGDAMAKAQARHDMKDALALSSGGSRKDVNEVYNDIFGE